MINYPTISRSYPAPLTVPNLTDPSASTVKAVFLPFEVTFTITPGFIVLTSPAY